MDTGQMAFTSTTKQKYAANLQEHSHPSVTSGPLTCLITSVPSLEGVMACSLSESSTSMVFADSVSPLLILL